MTSSGSVKWSSKRKLSSVNVSAICWYNTKNRYRAISKLLETENRIEKLPLIHFVLLFLFSPINEKWVIIFWAILHYLSLYSRLQVEIHQINLFWYSDLKSEIIFSIQHHYDVIMMYYLKVSKMTSFVSKNLRIYWFRVTNNFISGRYYKNNIRSPNLNQKSKRFDIQLKNGTLFVRNANVFSTFYTQQRKDDVIVTSLWIWSGFFISQNIHLIPTWFCTEFE